MRAGRRVGEKTCLDYEMKHSGISSSQTAPQVDRLKYSLTIGVATNVERGFYYPADTAIGEDGRLYVLSRSLEQNPDGVRVTVCNLESEYFGVFGTFGEGDGEFVWATAISIDSLGQIYVSDEYTDRITVFDPSGTFVAKWGVHGSSAGELDGPWGLAFDNEDNLYVSDQRNNRIQKFAKDGRFLLGFGSHGSDDGQLNLPWGVTVAPTGDVYVADWRNDRVQRFSPDGEFLAKHGTSGHGDGELYRPASVTVDEDGYMYVADWGNERVQVLDPDGCFVMKLRGEATLSKWGEEYMRGNIEEKEARSRADLEPDLSRLALDPFEESARVEKYFWAPDSVKLDSLVKTRFEEVPAI